ncbi:beta-ketoacyl synthase N-terminal-like domain-containing protein, partial [Amycolatopsis sp. NPDC059021]|uniref:type I polyketide synthase n=1 Tax=Amycolatopsis sp. NPDC059021 TaxID=3346704 RepID=UPI00366EF093
MTTSKALADRLAGGSAAERRRVLSGLVHESVLAVLREVRPDAPAAVDADRALRETGFDSLAMVALHARLSAETGLALPVTVAFDHPTPAALAAHLGALLAGETGAETAVAAAPRGEDEPIAIVGIGCRYPGGVRSAADLWRLVAEGGHALTGFPADRGWDLDGLFADGPDTRAGSYVRVGGFLPDAAEFDADFFGIGPREAAAMDPQQRLVLQITWEALERAGIDPAALRGTPAGVFLGSEPQEYGPRLFEAADGLDGYLLTGTAPSAVAGRVAYTFGLAGPAITVDTACSGSLVALHLAVQALRRAECSLALAGGVAVMGGPGTFTAFSRQRGLAPDGRCKAFAAAADGTGFAEGAGVLVLRRLSDAVHDGQRVLAVVRGSAVNSDGASNGFTAPSGLAQRQVIGQALADAGLRPSDVDAVEAHGTGTALGDPVEASALLATYGQDRAEPLRLGSVKSNLGHTQAAAGAAGVIKMVMAIRRGVLPATLHVDTPTPHVDWSAGSVELLTEARPWPETGRPRRAGVSSFGISGTNAHVVIEQAPPPEPEPVAETPPPAIPLPLSARGEQALRAHARQLAAALPGQSLVDVSGTLAARASLPHRAVLVAPDGEEAVRALNALAEGETPSGAVVGTVAPGGVGYLFTGQGSQRLDMGRELYHGYPVFAAALDETIDYLDLQLERSLRDVLYGSEPEALDETAYAQCALFAVEVALFRLLESWGVTPEIVAGHSAGELAAAHVAGLWSLEDACLVAAARARLMQELPRGGAMIAVQAREDEVRPLLTGGVSIAAVNARDAVVLSGAEEEVAALAGLLADGGHRTSRLRVSHAFHSALMEPMLAEYRRVLQVVDYHVPRTTIVSTVTGDVIGAAGLSTPDHWLRNVRDTVRFADAVRVMAGTGVRTVLELGPDAVLAAMTEGVTAVPVLRRDRSEAVTVLTAVATAYTRGAEVGWRAIVPAARPVDLPTYPFQGKRFWLPPGGGATDAARFGQARSAHPLLSAVVSRADGDGMLLTGRVSPATHGWLAEHAIAGSIMLPATAFVDMALYTASRAGCAGVGELTLRTPLVLPESGGVALQAVVSRPDESGDRSVRFYARREHDEDAAWTWHGEATLTATAPAAGRELVEWPPPGARAVPIETLYDDLSAEGYVYGPLFRGLQAVWQRGDEVFAEVALPGPAGGFGLHPALLDAVLHATDFAAAEARADGEIRLPFAWSGVTVHAAGATAVRARITTAAEGGGVAIDLAEASGGPRAGRGGVRGVERGRHRHPGRRRGGGVAGGAAPHPPPPPPPPPQKTKT